MAFRDRLFATLRAMRPLLAEPGVLMALGLLMTASPDDLLELATTYRALVPELRYAAPSNLTILSLLAPRPGMPDPRPERARVVDLLRRLETGEADLA